MTRQNKKSDKISLIALYLKGPQGRAHSSKGAKRPCSYLLQANQPFSVLGHRIVECEAGIDFLLEVVGELLGHFRVVTEQSPVTGILSLLLVFELAVQIETVVDAGAVADDQRRTTVS